MEMLNRYQLVNVRLSDFIIAQILMNLNAIFTWTVGLGFFIFHSKFKPYRIMGYVWVAVILFLILAHGKHYYTLGLYSMLFAAGGVAFEQFIRPKFLLYANLVFCIVINLPLFPLGLPLLNMKGCFPIVKP